MIVGLSSLPDSSASKTLRVSVATFCPLLSKRSYGVSALALVVIFLALHIANHLTFPAGEGTFDAVMKVFRHVYRNGILQPLVVALFLFQRARNGRLRTNIGNVATLDDAVAAFNPTERIKGKTIIRVRQ